MRALLWVVLVLGSAGFAKDRVSEVRSRRTDDLKAMLEKVGVSYPPDEVYLRLFKEDRQLELWVGQAGKPLVLLSTYPVCAASGELGPKRMEGDLQVPEGFYEVSQFHSTSNYHLALKVSYPNASDRVRSDAQHPGGLIYLHGGCASIGCIAIENEPVEEVYLLALDAKVRTIPFHIFPFRLTARALEAHADSPNAAFWGELAPGYQQFEASHRPPRFKVDAKSGAYSVR